MEATVYMLRCADGSYYVGLTRQEVETRLWEHQTGFYGGYTSARRPVELVFSEPFALVTEAIAFERQLTGWSRRKRKR